MDEYITYAEAAKVMGEEGRLDYYFKMGLIHTQQKALPGTVANTIPLYCLQDCLTAPQRHKRNIDCGRAVSRHVGAITPQNPFWPQFLIWLKGRT